MHPVKNLYTSRKNINLCLDFQILFWKKLEQARIEEENEYYNLLGDTGNQLLIVLYTTSPTQVFTCDEKIKFPNSKKSVINLKVLSRCFIKVRQITSLKVSRLQTTDMWT